MYQAPRSAAASFTASDRPSSRTHVRWAPRIATAARDGAPDRVEVLAVDGDEHVDEHGSTLDVDGVVAVVRVRHEDALGLVIREVAWLVARREDRPHRQQRLDHQDRLRDDDQRVRQEVAAVARVEQEHRVGDDPDRRHHRHQDEQRRGLAGAERPAFAVESCELRAMRCVRHIVSRTSADAWFAATLAPLPSCGRRATRAFRTCERRVTFALGARWVLWCHARDPARRRRDPRARRRTRRHPDQEARAELRRRREHGAQDRPGRARRSPATGSSRSGPGSDR